MDAAVVGKTDAGADSDAGSDAGGSDAATASVPYDTCAAPLDVSAGGTFTLDVGDAHGDYPVLVSLLCGGIVGDTCRDVVATFHLDKAQDVSILADTGVDGYVAIALQRTTCDGKFGPSVDVAHGYGPVALRHRALPPGTYFVFIGADPPDIIVIGGPPPGPLQNLELNVAFSPATQAPTNETCAAPIDLGTGGHFEGSFVDVTADVMACGYPNPDLVYKLTTTELSNVHVVAHANPDYLLQLALRSSCGAGSHSTCYESNGYPRTLERTYYNLPPDTYFLILEDWGGDEVDFTLDVDIKPPTSAPKGDTCADPILIEPGVPFSGSLVGLQGDVYSCGVGRSDAVHQFTISQESDVWIQARGGDFYVGLISSCEATSNVHCNSNGLGDVIATYIPALAAGTYYVVVDSYNAAYDAYELSVEAWPTPHVTPVSVSGNESCGTAFDVPPGGGVFVGDTTAAINDTNPTACGFTNGGAADVAFRWTTTVPRRVFATTSGSDFGTTLEVRDATCGALACDAWSGVRLSAPPYTSSAALDLMLPAGTYIFVVDSWYSSARGPYRFELRPL